MTRYRAMMRVYWAAAAAASLLALGAVTSWTLAEEGSGLVEVLFRLHVPAAINALLACAVVFVAGVGYLWQRRLWWDALAEASAKLAVLACAVVLLTGMLWAKEVWGRWWIWSPRLTFTLILLILYTSYVAVRPVLRSRERRALVSAVFGVVAFLDVPLVYLSVDLLPDVHPSWYAPSPSAGRALLVAFIPVTMISAGLIISGALATVRAHQPGPRPPVVIEARPPTPQATRPASYARGAAPASVKFADVK